MAEKKVVVQVLADTKPFIQSLTRLKKLAESLDNIQLKSGNKLVSNLLKTQKINKKIHDEAIKSAKIQSNMMKETVSSQNKLLKGAVKYVSIIDAIGRSYKFVNNMFNKGYDFGRGVVDPARTYGVNLTQATQANAMYSAFGGKAGGGTDVLSKFLQNRLEYQLYGRGALPEVAARYGVSQDVFTKNTLPEFIKSLRESVKQRGFSETAVQGMLQGLGMGGDAAIMRMLTGTDEEFAQGMRKMAETAQPSEDRLRGIEDTEKEFETMMTNIKTTLADWATYLKPVISAFNKLGPTTETLVATFVGAISALKALPLLKSAVTTATASAAAAGAGSAAGAGGTVASVAGGAGAAGVLGALGVGSLAAFNAYGQQKGLSEHFDLVDKMISERDERLGRSSKTENTLNVYVQSNGGDPRTFGERFGEAMLYQQGINLFVNGSM